MVFEVFTCILIAVWLLFMAETARLTRGMRSDRRRAEALVDTHMITPYETFAALSSSDVEFMVRNYWTPPIRGKQCKTCEEVVFNNTREHYATHNKIPEFEYSPEPNPFLYIHLHRDWRDNRAGAESRHKKLIEKGIEETYVPVPLPVEDEISPIKQRLAELDRYPMKAKEVIIWNPAVMCFCQVAERGVQHDHDYSNVTVDELLGVG